MELKWLEDLLSLSRTRSFSRTATERFCTQSALSRRIKALELWVGVPLVASKKTDSADILYPFTRVDSFRPGEAVAFLAKLLNNSGGFAEKVERTATKNLYHYSFAKSRERMTRILES